MLSRKLCLFIMLLILAAVPANLLAQSEGGETFQAIDWKKLAEQLPDELAGLKAGDVDGGSMSMSDPTNPGQTFSYSTVERTYTSDDEENPKKVTVRILDSGLNQMLQAPFMLAMEFDGPDGSMKTVELAGQKARQIIEKEDGKIESVQYLILVVQRFMVFVEGGDNASLELVGKVTEELPFDGLAGLVK